MRAILIGLAIVVASFGSTYLLGAYFSLEPNPFEWTRDGRVLHSYLSICVLAALSMWRLLTK